MDSTYNDQKSNNTRILIFNDYSLNLFIAWRLQEIGIDITLISDIVSPITWYSDKFEIQNYTPKKSFQKIELVNSQDKVEGETKESSKFDFVLLYASSITQLKQRSKAIINLIHNNTVVFVNSSFCVLLEPMVNMILPTTVVLSIIGKVDIKRFSKDKLFVNTESSVILIGLSCHNPDKKLSRLMNALSKKSLEILKSNDKNTQVDRFIRYLRFSKINSVFKLSPSGKKNTLVCEIWSRIIKILIYDCFAIIYNETDIHDLFYNQAFAPPIRNIFEETIILSRLCGNHDFLIKQKQKMDFMSDLIHFFENEKRKTSSLKILKLLNSEEINQFPKSIIHFPHCLYNNMMNFETNLSMLFFQLILIATEINADVPSLEFLNSILLLGANGVKQRPIKTNSAKQLTYAYDRNTDNCMRQPSITTKESHTNKKRTSMSLSKSETIPESESSNNNRISLDNDADDDENDSYESANSSIDPTLQNLYNNQAMFLDNYSSAVSNDTNETNVENRNEIKLNEEIANQADVKSKEPKTETLNEIQESVSIDEEESNNESSNSRSTYTENNNSTSSVSRVSFENKNLKYFNFNEDSHLIIRSSSRDCDYEVEDYIDSPYYQEQIDLSVLRSKRSHNHGHKLKNMVVENSSTSSRKGYRKNNPKSRNKDSQFVNHNKIIETLRSASAYDNENRYGALDSTTAIPEE